MWGSTLDKMQQLLQAKEDMNIQVVREYLDDRLGTIREVAAMVISEIGSAQDVPLLVKMVDDRIASVRLAAVYGIENLAGPDDIALLEKAASIKRSSETEKALFVVIERLKRKG